MQAALGKPIEVILATSASLNVSVERRSAETAAAAAGTTGAAAGAAAAPEGPGFGSVVSMASEADLRWFMSVIQGHVKSISLALKAICSHVTQILRN